MRPPILLPVLLVATFGVTPGLAAQQPVSARDLFLSPWHPPMGQTCSETDQFRFPSINAAFDSAQLAASLPRLSNGAAVVAIYVRGAMHNAIPDSAWAIAPPIHIVESTLPDSSAAQVRDALRHALRPDTAGSLIFRVDFVGVPSFRTGLNLACRPVLINDADIARYLDGTMPRNRRFPTAAVVQALVHVDGSTGYISLRQSSGESDLDAVAMSAARFMKFLPALYNRVPVPAMTSYPVRRP